MSVFSEVCPKSLYMNLVCENVVIGAEDEFIDHAQISYERVQVLFNFLE